MLARLRIRQKIALLLVVPLTAVALTMATFAADRAITARTSQATAETALVARDIGGLIQALQQERLFALGYLVVPTLERSALAVETQTAKAELDRLANQPRTAEIIARAQPQLDAVERVRPLIIERTVLPRNAYAAYRGAIDALLNSLNLANAPAADADGLRELLALDALMRSNEEASSLGAIVVGSALDATLDWNLLTAALNADEQHLDRFRQLAAADQIELVDAVNDGPAAARLRRYLATVTSGPDRTGDEISEALTAALTYTGLRRLAQDRVARDTAIAAEQDAAAAARTAVGVAVGASLLFLAVVASAITVGRSISRPLRRLGLAVGRVAELSRAELGRVADSEAREVVVPELASVDVDSSDEIGELAAAVNRVQATAASLLERQATARANVATMFANISRRTQNLVGRQLNMIEELSRKATDPAVRERLSQLEHVTTRLRRSADSLMVVSGTVDQRLSTMPTRLSEIIDAALLEIEGFAAVEVVQPLPDLAVSADLAPDLRLLLAELLENATNFSPPGNKVQIGVVDDRKSGAVASYAPDCTIAVVDHGVGMSPARMAEENQRLVERERLDVAPTRVLGLFVVGRLARRHGLTVRLDPTPDHGVTAFVRIPARMLTPASPSNGSVPLGVVPPIAAAAIESASRSGPFPWLSARSGPAAIGAAPVSGAPVSGAPVSGAPVSAALSPVPVPGAPTAAQTVAGAHGAAPGAARPVGTARPPVPAARPNRDPEAERDALNDYLSGFARAQQPAPDTVPRPTPAERHP